MALNMHYIYVPAPTMSTSPGWMSSTKEIQPTVDKGNGVRVDACGDVDAQYVPTCLISDSTLSEELDMALALYTARVYGTESGQSCRGGIRGWEDGGREGGTETSGTVYV